jgi:hypothetical protein
MSWRGAAISMLLASGAMAQTSRTGFEPAAFVGIGGFVPTPQLASWTIGQRNPSVALHALLAYRVVPAIDLGLHVAHQWLAVSDLPQEADSAYASAAGGGLAMRFHPLSLTKADWIDPSIGVGVDLFAYSRQATRITTPEESEVRDAISGASALLIAGLDVAIANGLALSGCAIYSPWWLAESCSSQGTGLPACQPATGTAHYYFVGLGLRLHLRFVE